MAGKGAGAASMENVVIRNGECAVTYFPELGGKIASIVVKGHELLQGPLAPYGARTQTMGFDEGDASGWDECLPSVAGCTVETAAGPAMVPDHGDLWRVPWQVVSVSGTCVTLKAQCFSLPLEVERMTTLIPTDQGWLLRADYTVTNIGTSAVPWSWAAHPLFTAEAGDVLFLPDSIRKLRLEGSGGNRLGHGGAEVSWPVAKLAAGGETDLSLAEPPESGIGDKLFAGPLTAEENWCALERPRVGLRIKVRFSPAATPYLGLWICHGGWPDRPGPKQTCVAMEPATAPVDSLATTGAWSRTLAAGESFSWPMIVEIESI